MAALKVAWCTWPGSRADIAKSFATSEGTLRRIARVKGWPPRKRTGEPPRVWSRQELRRLKGVLRQADLVRGADRQRKFWDLSRAAIAGRFGLSRNGLALVIKRHGLLD